MEDIELLERLRRGDRDGFDAAFRAYYVSLVRTAEAIVGDIAIAEDLVQEVMLVLWRRRETLAIDDSLRAYLHRAARNRALNHLRHERVRRRKAPLLAGPDSVASTAPAALADDELAHAVERALATLPDRCREVFLLSRDRHLKYSEIAAVLGISVKTVEAQMGKALRLLRERLAPLLE